MAFLAVAFIPVTAGLAASTVISDEHTDWVQPEQRVTAGVPDSPESAMTNAVRAAFKSPRPISDAAGRIRYIIKFANGAINAYSEIAHDDSRFPNWQLGQARNLVADYAVRYGFDPIAMTSWTGATVTAFLTESQVEALASDRQVAEIWPDGYIWYSSTWTDTLGPPFVSWGTNAIGHASTVVTGIKVYVIDTGIGYHQDFNVVERVNVVQGFNPVGCLPHSSHVAGIIGANGASTGGSIGISPGVPIVSISTSDANDASNSCAIDLGSNTLSYLAQAIDLTKSKITQDGHVGIVNISQNSAWFTSSGPLGSHIASLATPSAGYPGAFVVESAGNFFDDACNYAMSGSGVFVVGALDSNGQAVRPLNGIGGFQNSGLMAGSQPGSDYGSCVTLWAPGNNIYSTWDATARVGGGLPVQRSDTVYSLHGLLSGTSMAAPHIAGMAAWLASTYGLSTPSQIGAAISARSFNLGSFSYSSNGSNSWPIVTANMTGARPIPSPTAQLAIESVPNGSVSTNEFQPFRLQYDSVGAQSCTVNATMNGHAWYTLSNFSTAYDWGNIVLNAGDYGWAIDCVSQAGTHGTSSATAHVTAGQKSSPVAQWLVNGANVNGQTIYLPRQNSIMLKFAASASTSCYVHTRYGPNPGTTLSPWYSYTATPPAGTNTTYYNWVYEWGPVQYVPYTYEYNVDCSNASGTTTTATFTLRVT